MQHSLKVLKFMVNVYQLFWYPKIWRYKSS